MSVHAWLNKLIKRDKMEGYADKMQGYADRFYSN